MLPLSAVRAVHPVLRRRNRSLPHLARCQCMPPSPTAPLYKPLQRYAGHSINKSRRGATATHSCLHAKPNGASAQVGSLSAFCFVQCLLLCQLVSPCVPTGQVRRCAAGQAPALGLFSRASSVHFGTPALKMASPRSALAPPATSGRLARRGGSQSCADCRDALHVFSGSPPVHAPAQVPGRAASSGVKASSALILTSPTVPKSSHDRLRRRLITGVKRSSRGSPTSKSSQCPFQCTRQPETGSF